MADFWMCCTVTCLLQLKVCEHHLMPVYCIVRVGFLLFFTVNFFFSENYDFCKRKRLLIFCALCNYCTYLCLKNPHVSLAAKFGEMMTIFYAL